MKKKIVLSAAFVLSLLPMLMNQYGGCRGVQEISGMINLFNPIGILSVISFTLGVWAPFNKSSISTLLGAAGVIGVVASEIYTFFTWHILTITGKMSLQSSLSLAYPEFYIGLAVSSAMMLAYFFMMHFIKE